MLAILNHKNPRISLSRILVTSTMEVCQRIHQYIYTCAWSKVEHHQPYGFLQPQPILSQPWMSISMYFITHLPLVDRFDPLVHYFTIMAHFSPSINSVLEEETIDLFLKNVIWLHGLLDDITWNSRSHFVSHQNIKQFIEYVFNISSTN